MSAASKLDRLEVENERLRSFIGGVLMESLLGVRRAAFSPEIGCRYTESIRSDIAGECRRLEDACRAVLSRDTWGNEALNHGEMGAA